MSDLTRREALFVAGACACCAMSVDLARADEGDQPKPQGPSGAPAALPKRLQIGKPADFAKPGFYDKFAKQKLMVANLGDKLVAMTTVCPHKGCSVKPNPANPQGLKCPCHKAEFNVKGVPTHGPAKSPLDRFALSQEADGVITVDMTKSFIESKWEDPAAFIALKPAEAAK